ncbi:hypothetical protein FWD20_00035 [Candidatus Saccharibacteria bacterium]|nr:hypothetical protein [Candidatus Saccharibacteria bacterium]
MYQNKEITLERFSGFRYNLLAGLLSLGVIVTGLHGASLFEKNSISPTDFKSQIVKELHTHDHSPFKPKPVLADLRQLRNVGSEGDKVAENDSKRSNWDVYQF